MTILYVFYHLEKKKNILLIPCCSRRRQKDSYDDSQGSFNCNKLQNSISIQDLEVTTESAVKAGKPLNLFSECTEFSSGDR